MKKLIVPACLAFRLAVAAVFVYSGWSKLMEPSSNFVGVILGYKIVDVRTAVWMAAALPWAEFVAGVFLFLGLWTGAAVRVFAALCLVFFAAISSTILRGIPLHDCGCFGQGPHAMPLWGTLLVDASLFLTLALLGWRREETEAVSLDRLLKA